MLDNISVNKEGNGTVESTTIFKYVARIRKSSCRNEIFSAVQIMPSMRARQTSTFAEDECENIARLDIELLSGGVESVCIYGVRSSRMEDGGEGDGDLSKLPSGRVSRVMKC